jgi:hypothetical protein
VLLLENNLIDRSVGSSKPKTNNTPMLKFIQTAVALFVVFTSVGQLTLTADLSCAANPSPLEVRITGPFWGWDPTGGPTATDNGDGTWSVVLDPAPAVDMEYLWVSDGVQENLIQSMVDGGTCAPITDFVNYANRQWLAGGADVTGDIYGSCTGCGPAPLVLELDMSCSAITSPGVVGITGPFWGWDPLAGPIAVDNGNGIWTVTLAPAPTADMEYLWVVDGVQENLIQAMVDGGTCAPVTDFANFANRQWIVGDADISDTHDQCDACPSTCGALLSLTFDDATSIDAWSEVADATLPEATLGWNASGVTTGALEISALNSAIVGRAYIFQYDNAAVNYDGATSVQVSFEAKISTPLAGTAVHFQTNLPGIGVTTNLDIQTGGLNDATWTTYTFDYPGVGAGTNFSMNFNLAAGAFIGSGGALLIDNMQLSCTSTEVAAPVSLTAEVCGAPATGLRITGPLWGWDPNAGPVASDNGDGTWTVVLDPAPTVDFEYLWVADGVQENLIQAMVDGGTCAPITDFANYANRLWTVGAGDVSETYGQCAGCSQPPLTLTLDVSCSANATPAAVSFTGPFWGWDPNAGPVATDNGDGTWTVTLDPAPSGNMEYLWSVDGVQENLIQAMIDGGDCAPVTDFVAYANREWAAGEPDVADTFGQCEACAVAGPGCTDVAAVNYDAAATEDDGTCQYNVTFQVDMNEYLDPFTTVYVAGSYNGWCADCNPMEDPELDGIWTATYPIPNGEYQFKYQLDMWAADEPLVAGQSCVQSNGGVINRTLSVASADQTFDLVCWASCYPCASGLVPGCNNSNAVNFDPLATVNDGTCLLNVTFSVDMQDYVGTYTDVHLNGQFNGWCGDCAPMEDLDLDLVYELTVEMQEGYYEFKYTTDNFTDQEIFSGTESCIVENFGFSNRFAQPTDNLVLDVVCWNSCTACVATSDVFGCTNTNATNYDPAATADDGSCLYEVILSVNMNQYVDSYTTVYVSGGFNGWNGLSNPMSDADLDNVWEVTVLFPEGANEYKFTIDDWAVQENFIGGEACTVTIGGFTNRSLIVSGNTTVNTVCWNSCIACSSNSYTLTFRVDMTNETVDANGIQLVASFQGFDPLATPMTYLGYGIYEYSIILLEGTVLQYKYLNGIDFLMAEMVPVECGVDDGNGGFNRTHTVGEADETILVCFSECDACAGCTDPLSAEYNPFAGMDDGSCLTPLVYGCTYADAMNYAGSATIDDGSCMFMLGSDCPEDLNNDGLVNATDLLQFLGAFGSTCL